MSETRMISVRLPNTLIEYIESYQIDESDTKSNCLRRILQDHMENHGSIDLKEIINENFAKTNKGMSLLMDDINTIKEDIYLIKQNIRNF